LLLTVVEFSAVPIANGWMLSMDRGTVVPVGVVPS
jgi:hypothetical protein